MQPLCTTISLCYFAGLSYIQSPHQNWQSHSACCPRCSTLKIDSTVFSITRRSNHNTLPCFLIRSVTAFTSNSTLLPLTLHGINCTSNKYLNNILYINIYIHVAQLPSLQPAHLATVCMHPCYTPRNPGIIMKQPYVT